MSTEEAPRELIPQESSQRLHRMQDFDSQEVKMSTAKHLPLEKFEAIDMPLDDSLFDDHFASGPGFLGPFSCAKWVPFGSSPN